MRLIPMEVKAMGHVMSETDLFVFIGEVAGECYNSSKDTEACIKRAFNCIKRGHHSPWEHYSLTLKCTVDRGVSHALVRHRHCAHQQSSTIYQKYQEIECIGNDKDVPNYIKQAYAAAEIAYMQALNDGKLPSEARDVLPTDLATNLIITTNIREWMYMLQRRCGPGDSTKMHQWQQMVHAWFEETYPRILTAFEVWYERHPL